MDIEIPEEQLTRVRPLVQALLVSFREIEKTIPLDTDSALIYDLQSGENA